MSRSLKSTSSDSQSNPTQVEEKSTQVTATPPAKPVMVLSLHQLSTIVDSIVAGYQRLAEAFPAPLEGAEPVTGTLRVDQAKAAHAVVAVGEHRPSLFQAVSAGSKKPTIDLPGSTEALARWDLLHRLSTASAEAEPALVRARYDLGEEVKASVELAYPIASAVAAIDPSVDALLAPARVVYGKPQRTRRKNELPGKRIEAADARAARSAAKIAKVEDKAARDRARADALKAKTAENRIQPASPKSGSAA